MGIDKVLSRSLMKRLISLSGISLVKGGAVSGPKFQRALTYDVKEVSIDNQRPQLNGSKEFRIQIVYAVLETKQEVLVWKRECKPMMGNWK